MYDEDKTLIDDPYLTGSEGRRSLDERRARRERRLTAGRTSARSEERVGRPIDPHRVLRAIRRGKWWLLIGLFGGFAIGAALWKFVFPREYSAYTTLQFEGTGPEDSSLPPDPTELRTLINSVKTPLILTKIQERNDLRGSTLQQVSARFDIGNEDMSNVVTVVARSDSPEKAAGFANSVVEIFLEDRQRLEREYAQEMIDSKQRELDGATESHRAARDEYNTFRRTHGIANLSIEQQTAIQQAANLISQANLARTEASAADAQLAHLRRDDGSASVTQRGTAEQRAQLSELRRQLASERTQLTDDHPRIRALQAQVAQLERQMETTTSTVSLGGREERRQLTSTQLSRAAAEERHSELERLAHEARERVAQLSDMEGEASNLLAAVHIQQARVNRIRDELSQWQDRFNNPQTGFRVTAAARPPRDPENSKIKYAVVFAPGILFFVIALLWFLGREIGKLRPHTAAEVAYWGKGPVVGASTWPVDNRALGDLIDEMDDYLLDATGRTLVVPASEKEASLVGPLADRLGEDSWAPTTFIGCVAESLPELEDTLDPDSIQPGTALALRDDRASLARMDEDPSVLDAQPWIGPMAGPSLRRAARLADRVLVVVHAGSMTGPELAQLPGRLGREEGIAYLVVGLDEEFVGLPDRAGEVSDFWGTYRGE